MEIKQLKRFLAVVEHGSLAAAAPGLGLTQQALGASIAGLERELGVVVLDRRAGGQTAITEYGKMLVRHARAIIASEQRAVDDIEGFRSARGGEVTIGIGETFAPEAIAEAVRHFHERRPNVRISLFEDYSEALLERLIDGKLDIIAGSDVASADQGVIRFPLYATRDIVIARAEHPLAGRAKLTLADLQPYTWMAPYSRPADAEVVRNAFLSAGLEAPSRFIWTDARTVGSHLLLLDDYLFMTSPTMTTGLLTGPRAMVRLNISEPSVERRAGLLYTALTHLNPAAMQLMDEIRETVHRHVSDMSYALPLNEGRRLVVA
jgi:DNA-binding transcriptional LysR family regulator